MFSKSCLEKQWVYTQKNHHPDKTGVRILCFSSHFELKHIVILIFMFYFSKIYLIQLMNIVVCRGEVKIDLVDVSSAPKKPFSSFSFTPECCVILWP